MTGQQRTLLCVVLAAGACGGPGASGALNARVSEAHLAPVPMEDRQQVADAQTEAFLANWQVKYTETELSAAKSEVEVARNNVKKAKLSVKSADTRRKHADGTADLDLIGEAEREQTVAGLEVNVAEQALARAEKRVAYLEARLEAEKLVVRREEARAEYAKAQGMAAAGVSPPDFDAKRYASQYKKRESLANAALEKVQVQKRELEKVEESLSSFRAELENAKMGATAAPPDDTTATTPPLPVDEPPDADPPAPVNAAFESDEGEDAGEEPDQDDEDEGEDEEDDGEEDEEDAEGEGDDGTEPAPAQDDAGTVPENSAEPRDTTTDDEPDEDDAEEDPS